LTRQLKGVVLGRMNLTIHFEEELDPAKTYVLGVHPHSILPWGASPPADRCLVFLDVLSEHSIPSRRCSEDALASHVSRITCKGAVRVVTRCRG